MVLDLSKERRAFIWKGQEVPEQLIAEDERTAFLPKRRERLCDKQRPIQFPLDIKLTRHDLCQLVTRTLSFYGIRVPIAAVTQVWQWHHNPD
jgi:hypothetical protein